MRRVLENILKRKLILAIKITLLDVVILIGYPSDADAFCVSFLIDDETTKVVLAV